MKKRFGIIILAIIFGLIVGCSQKSNPQNSNVPVNEIISEVKNQIVEDLKAGGLKENDILNDGQLMGYVEADLKTSEEAEFYVENMDLDTEKLEEGIILAPMINVNSDQIIILKANEIDDVADLQESLNREHENQIRVWEQYLPDQYEKVKNTIIKTEGKYLLYVTYEHPEKIEAVFDQSLQK